MSDRRVKELTSEQEGGLIHTLPMWARKRLKRAEIMLTATQSNYVREHDLREHAESRLAAATKMIAELVACKDAAGPSVGAEVLTAGYRWTDAWQAAREFMQGEKA